MRRPAGDATAMTSSSVGTVSPVATPALSVRRPLERRIVDDHDLAVPRQVDVELDEIGAESDGVPEGEEAVLGPEKRAAAVRGQERGGLPLPSHRARDDGETEERPARHQDKPHPLSPRLIVPLASGSPPASARTTLSALASSCPRLRLGSRFSSNDPLSPRLIVP